MGSHPDALALPKPFNNRNHLMKTPAEIQNGLAHFSGSESLTAHWTRRLNYTEGVAYLAEAAELLLAHRPDRQLPGQARSLVRRHAVLGTGS